MSHHQEWERDFQSALDELLQKNTIPDAFSCLETILVFVRNIISFPKDPKYRVLNKKNVALVQFVTQFPGAEIVLSFLGFMSDGDKFVMDASLHLEEQHTLRSLRSLVQSSLSLLSQHDTGPPSIVSCRGNGLFHSVGFHEDIGKRSTMEDGHVIFPSFADSENLCYFGLYDGHGGRSAVDFTIKNLHQVCFFQCSYLQNIAREVLANTPFVDMESTFCRAFLQTDAQMRRHNIWDSGATIASCILNNLDGCRWLHCANAGDSRIVLAHNGHALRMTRDHKPNDPSEAQRIAEVGGFVTGGSRVNGILAVSRALGDHALKPSVSASPFCQSVPVTSGHDFCILACDGLWDVCTDQAAVDYVYSILATTERSPELAASMARGLVDLALSRNSSDNVSVMVLLL